MRILDNLGKLEDYPKSDLKKCKRRINKAHSIYIKKRNLQKSFQECNKEKYNKTKLNKLSDKKLDQLYNSILEHSRK